MQSSASIPRHASELHRNATVGSRAAAYIVDMLVLLLVWLVFILALALAFPGRLPTASQLGLALGGWFATQCVMFSVQEATMQGQTIGKRFMGLRVVDAGGGPASVGQVLLRNLVRPVDELPYGFALGTLLAGLSTEGCRLGDRLARTRVIHTPLPSTPPLDLPLDASPEERAALEAWFAAEGTLEPTAHVRLSQRMVGWAQQRWPERFAASEPEPPADALPTTSSNGAAAHTASLQRAAQLQRAFARSSAD